MFGQPLYEIWEVPFTNIPAAVMSMTARLMVPFGKEAR